MMAVNSLGVEVDGDVVERRDGGVAVAVALGGAHGTGGDERS